MCFLYFKYAKVTLQPKMLQNLYKNYVIINHFWVKVSQLQLSNLIFWFKENVNSLLMYLCCWKSREIGSKSLMCGGEMVTDVTPRGTLSCIIHLICGFKCHAQTSASFQSRAQHTQDLFTPEIIPGFWKTKKTVPFGVRNLETQNQIIKM